MSTTALTSARKSTQAIGRPLPLLAVLIWELRRVRASRLLWIQALCFFVLLLFVMWIGRAPISFGFGFNNFTVIVAGTSAWGLFNSLPSGGMLLLLVFFLPFVTADAVTRDLQRRTHELLMATALPTRAYVWGRYLMGLLLSLGLALLMLGAILLMGLLLHLTIPDYPAPQIDNVLILWGAMVLPATILVSSVSFALGTLLPRLSMMVKIGIMVVWFIGMSLPHSVLGDQTAPPAWYSAWDPTYTATGQGMVLQYTNDFQKYMSQPKIIVTQIQQELLAVENRLYNFGTWLAPHLLLAGLSLLLVVLAAFSFQRFRNAFGA